MKQQIKTTSKALIVASVMAGISLPVLAAEYTNYDGYRQYDDAKVDYAQVVNVSPILETYQVNKPREQCWDERVPVKSNRHHKSRTGEIFGAIVGGAIGNQFGSGNGRKVATAAGAILGASVANDIKYNKRHQYQGQDRYQVVRQCELRDNYVQEQQVVGYNVAYKYQGNVFHTEMDRHPGDRIQVRVSVDPI